VPKTTDRNFTVLVAINNTPVVVSAGCAHTASSWACDSLPVSLDKIDNFYYDLH